MRRFLFLLLMLSSLGFGAKTSEFSLDQIPDGYPSGRKDAPHGSYSTPYNKLKNYAEAVELLERKVYGLANMSDQEDVIQAKAAYYLEYLTVGLIKKVSIESGPDSFESESLKSRLRDNYARLRVFQERMFETMVRRIDVALPGSNGLQVRIENAQNLEILYGCNCRKDSLPTLQEQKDYYKKKLRDFTDSGGKPSELHKLDASYLKSLPAYTHLEYVERQNGEVWVTEGKAGHVVLAEGDPVRAAGQMVVVKDHANRVSLFVSSNASGTYKPDIFSVKQMMNRIAEPLAISRENMVITLGDPMGVQTVSVLLKAKGIESAIIKDTVKQMETEGSQMLVASEKYIKSLTFSEKYVKNVTLLGTISCSHAFSRLGQGALLPRLTYQPK